MNKEGKKERKGGKVQTTQKGSNPSNKSAKRWPTSGRRA